MGGTPDKEGLRFDTIGKPFTYVDAKKDLGHGGKKPCPKRGNKEENAGVRDLNHQLEESRTQKNKSVPMKFVGGKRKEKSVTIIFEGGKAGVGISYTSGKGQTSKSSPTRVATQEWTPPTRVKKQEWVWSQQ